MDTDSDDDALLSQSTFKKTNRREGNKQAKLESVLDQALKDSKKSIESSLRIQQMRRENRDDPSNGNDELLHARVEKMIESNGRPRALEDAFDSAFSQEESLELKTAIEADQVCQLGLRRGIVKFDASKFDSFFQSISEAVQDLPRVFALDRKHKMYAELMNAADHGVLAQFLQSKKLAIPSTQSLDINPETFRLFCEWLLKVAYSAGLDGRQMSLLGRSATETLLSLRMRGDFSKRISCREYNGTLGCWVHRDNHEVRELNHDVTLPVGKKNLIGLENFLSLWGDALLLPTDDAASELEVSNCVARLAVLGLDDSIEVLLRDSLQQSLCHIIDSVAESTSDEKQLKSWISHAAKATTEGVEEFGPGSGNAEDADDTNGRLCLSAAVHTIRLGTSRGNSTTAVLRYQAELALCALQRLLVEEASRPTDTKSFVIAMLQASSCPEFAGYAESSTSWLAITAAFACLKQFDTRDDGSTNPTKFLACVDCLMVCYKAGLHLLGRDPANSSNQGGEFGSAVNATKLVSFLEVFDDLVEKVSLRTYRKSASSAHFRLAHAVLLEVHLYNVSIRDRVKYSASGNTSSGATKQAKMSQYFVKADAIAPTGDAVA